MYLECPSHGEVEGTVVEFQTTNRRPQIESALHCSSVTLLAISSNVYSDRSGCKRRLSDISCSPCGNQRGVFCALTLPGNRQSEKLKIEPRQKLSCNIRNSTG